MKKIITLFLIAYSVHSNAQCNDSYFPFEEGIRFEQTSFNKKDKEEGKTLSEVVTIDGSSAIVKSLVYDKKGEEIANGEYSIICEGNTIKMDFNNFIPDEVLNQYGDADVTVEGDFITIPDDLQPGQSLPDGAGTVTIKMSGGAMNIKMDMTITDRKVEKTETLTTSAGSFDTYKISQKTIMKMNIMGMNKTTESTSASWYSKGVGMVRNESYNKNGDLIGYTLLTAFNK